VKRDEERDENEEIKPITGKEMIAEISERAKNIREEEAEGPTGSEDAIISAILYAHEHPEIFKEIAREKTRDKKSAEKLEKILRAALEHMYRIYKEEESHTLWLENRGGKWVAVRIVPREVADKICRAVEEEGIGTLRLAPEKEDIVVEVELNGEPIINGIEDIAEELRCTIESATGLHVVDALVDFRDAIKEEPGEIRILFLTNGRVPANNILESARRAIEKYMENNPRFKVYVMSREAWEYGDSEALCLNTGEKTRIDREMFVYVPPVYR